MYVGIDMSKGNSEGELANVTMRILDQDRCVEVTAWLAWLGWDSEDVTDRL